jgi:DNA polymerase III subunit epsilon
VTAVLEPHKAGGPVLGPTRQPCDLPASARLFATAIALGLTDGIMRALLDEARDAMVENRGKDCKPLPVGWAHGEPLRIGEGVALTGCDRLARARLEGRAQAAGLWVTGSVLRKTAVLVTDGADPYTTKAISAREHGTRVVTPSVFVDLVEHIQPDAQATAKSAAAAPA